MRVTSHVYATRINCSAPQRPRVTEPDCSTCCLDDSCRHSALADRQLELLEVRRDLAACQVARCQHVLCMQHVKLFACRQLITGKSRASREG